MEDKIDIPPDDAQEEQLTTLSITRVWLDESVEDCTMCGLCQNTCPEVFSVPDKMTIVPNPDLTQIGGIKEAAEACPVSVIAYEINKSGARNNPR